MQCSCCGSENNSTKDFCRECGHSLLKTHSSAPYTTYTSKNAELLKVPLYLSMASIFFLLLQVATVSISSTYSGTVHILYLLIIVRRCNVGGLYESFASLLLLTASFFYVFAILLQIRFCRLCLKKEKPKIHLLAHRTATKFTWISALISLTAIPLAGRILSSGLVSSTNVVDLFFFPYLILLTLTFIGKHLIRDYYAYAIHHPGNSLSQVRALTKKSARKQSV